MTRFTINENFVDAVTETPIIHRILDETPNDSDKMVTVPDGEMWHLNTAYAKLVTSAVAGNRQITIEAQNSAGTVIGRISAGATQPASTTRHYQGMQGTYRESAFMNNDIQIPIPADAYLLSGSSLRIYDSAAIDPTGDDMTFGLSVKKYKGF